jgi:hypothetical protein
LQIFSGDLRRNEFLFPLGAAVVKAVFAGGSAKIIGNDPTGHQAPDRKFSHFSSNTIYLKILLRLAPAIARPLN